MTAVVLVHHDDYADWVFDSHHPTQGRRFTKGRELLLELADEAGIDVIEIDSDLPFDRGPLSLYGRAEPRLDDSSSESAF